MSSRNYRRAAPVIGLAVLAAGVTLAGVGIVASGTLQDTASTSLGAANPPPAAPGAPQAVPPPAAPPAPAMPIPLASGSAPPTATSPTAVPSATASAPDQASTAAAATATPSKPKSVKAKVTASTAAAATKAAAKGPTKAASNGPAKAPATSAVGAAPGTYGQTSSGSIVTSFGSMPVSGNATLTVGPAAGQAQTQTTNDGSNSEVEKLVFGAGRVDATELSITTDVLDSDFVLSPQEPLIELTPGATWSWKADSTDGKEHLALTGSYAGTETVVVGGVSETAAIIKSTLTVTGSIATTITQTDDYDPGYRLVLREHQTAKGTYMGFAYNADVTTTLSSLTPS